MGTKRSKNLKNWAAKRRRARRIDQGRRMQAAREAHERASARPANVTFQNVQMGYAGPGKPRNPQATAIRIEGGKLVGDNLNIDSEAFRHTIDATDADIDLTDSDA
jgi:hypothetical protein